MFHVFISKGTSIYRLGSEIPISLPLMHANLRTVSMDYFIRSLCGNKIDIIDLQCMNMKDLFTNKKIYYSTVHT
jgi:hypothetical protein